MPLPVHFPVPPLPVKLGDPVYNPTNGHIMRVVYNNPLNPGFGVAIYLDPTTRFQYTLTYNHITLTILKIIVGPRPRG